MITIDRNLIRQVLPVFKRAVNGGHRSRSAQPLQFLAGPESLQIRVTTQELGVEYRVVGEFEPTRFAVPLEVLSECQGRPPDPVQFDVSGGNVHVEWTDGSIPCCRTVPFDQQTDFSFPEPPATLTATPAMIISDLCAAVATCDPESSRYALGCLQLRGGAGQIVATDGRQLLVQAGYEFPWDDAVLIPASKVFGSPELNREEPVRIGRSEKHVTVAMGPWTIHMAINQEGRFPRIDDMLCAPAASSTQVELAPADAEFLVAALKRLPSDESGYDPITLDLNGQVILRARSVDESRPMELVMSNSRAIGEPVRLVTNRRYLARAAKLGLRELLLYGSSSPAIARDDCRTYLWALLDASDAIPPTDDAVRVESPDSSPTSQTTQRHRRKIQMSHLVSTEPTHAEPSPVRAVNAQSRRRSAASAIDQAASLKASLRDALSNTNELIRSLKQQQKQSRVVETTLASLKQLQKSA